MNPPEVALAPFTASAAALLAHWLAEPHIAPWYPEPAEHLAWALEPPQGGERALILCDGKPVGYLRWQAVSRQILDSVGLVEIPQGSVDIDILIGDRSFAGHGVGPRALGLLADQLQYRQAIPLLGLTTSVANIHARRAFEKAGFHVLRQYTPPGYGPCHLMVRSMHRVPEDS